MKLPRTRNQPNPKWKIRNAAKWADRFGSGVESVELAIVSAHDLGKRLQFAQKLDDEARDIDASARLTQSKPETGLYG